MKVEKMAQNCDFVPCLDAAWQSSKGYNAIKQVKPHQSRPVDGIEQHKVGQSNMLSVNEEANT